MELHKGLSALPITVRTLETIMRLSTAAAKARLAKRAAPVLMQPPGGRDILFLSHQLANFALIYCVTAC